MKASLHRIASRLYLEPWLIRRDKHSALLQQFQAAATGRVPALISLQMPGEPDDDDDGPSAAQCADMDCLSRIEISNGIAIVPVFGILGKHLDLIDSLCGGYDLNTLQAQTLALQNRGDVETVILHLNTPGGAAAGVADAAQCLRELAGTKRLIAYCDEACSGGQWLACAADEIYCGQSAMMGSIGALCAILDESQAFADLGWKMELFTDGPLKGAGVEGTSLTPAQAADIQFRINHIGGMFKTFVTSRRPGITADTMQGQWFYGDQAVALGLADGLAPSLEHVIASALN